MEGRAVAGIQTLYQVALCVVAYLTTGGYSHLQVRAVRETGDIGTKVGQASNIFVWNCFMFSPSLSLQNFISAHIPTFNVTLTTAPPACTSVSAPASHLRPQLTNIGRDMLGVFFTGVICSFLYLEVINERFETYLDPVGAMIYITALLWTCIPLVRC